MKKITAVDMENGYPREMGGERELGKLNFTWRVERKGYNSRRGKPTLIINTYSFIFSG
ncbi:Uncharacterised protein [uncultured archaeon]|nr:Uncharacterised protein [uncultured archaeon]